MTKPWIQCEDGTWINSRNIVAITPDGDLRLCDGDVVSYYKDNDDKTLDPEKFINRIGGRPIPFEGE